ncbi:MAG: hypothetical protein ABJA02_01985 [Acidobacteriota bacterium]
MDNRTSQPYRELTWSKSELDRFPIDLDDLIIANAQLERSLSGISQLSDDEQKQLLNLPMDRTAVFSYFGLMLGIFVPATMFLTFVFQTRPDWSPMIGLLLVMANAASALVGFHFGKVVARIVAVLEKQSTGEYIILSVFTGALWGIVSGALSGLFLFLIGGIFGAVIGGVTGAVALPSFLIPYNAVKRGSSIELSHFLPISVGVTAIICSFILHFLIR